MNLPQSIEGWQVWDLVQRLGGQLRVVSGAGGGAVIGWDIGAALQLGAALGIRARVIGELLPPIEAAMVRKMSAQGEEADG
ncbi:DUF7697 family protein [Thalassobacter stenotrophicus]|uniref:DUF7697 family protein n=1 Tax=Thalassobacter stenotrophicus TaxID=266809 RepID=UPI000A41E304|nr:hypothetical protein [Thalassobacter stenotrophicus]